VRRVPRAVIIPCAVLLVSGVALAVPWGARHFRPALPRPSCGSAVTHLVNGQTQIFSATRGALECFTRAARECRSAGIAVTEIGVDAGTDYVFTVDPGQTPCRATELSQDYWANFGGGQGRVSATPCRVAAVTRGGVRLSCGGRNALIPARVTVAPGQQHGSARQSG
jgi:hypothetical protein